MDLEEIGMSAFSVELLQKLSKDFYNIGRQEGFDAGFTAALCTIASVGKKESAEDALKYAKDFLNGPLANKEAKDKSRRARRSVRKSRTRRCIEMNLDEYTDKLAELAEESVTESDLQFLKGRNVYLSGPITGVKGYKYPFIFMEKVLHKVSDGMVFNPATEIPSDSPYEAAMATCLQALSLRVRDGEDEPYYPMYGVMILLPGWTKSKGAQIENRVAEACGIEVIEMSLSSKTFRKIAPFYRALINVVDNYGE